MSPMDELVPLLKKLRLSGVLQTLELRIAQSVEEGLAHPEFLVRLFSDELERRSAKMLDRRMGRANFEPHKTLEDFDFHFNPQIPKAKIIDLAAGLFIARHENVLLLGPSGVGKSHLAQAIGHRACLRGHTVLCLAAQVLFKRLRAARGSGSYDRRLLDFTNPDLLIIDDLGIYELIRTRYQRRSIIITSNRAAEELPATFADPLLASAAMDRLLHGAHVLVIEGDSYRNPPPSKRRAKRSAPSSKETTP